MGQWTKKADVRIPTFSLSEVAWLRERACWLSTRPYNALWAKRTEGGGGDFNVLCDSRDAQLFGVPYVDHCCVESPRWKRWSGLWLYTVRPFTVVVLEALQRAKGGGVRALKEEWAMSARDRRAEWERDRVPRRQRRARLKVALEGVGVDLDALRSSVDDEWWDAGDFSFGRVQTSTKEVRTLGASKWMLRLHGPRWERFTWVLSMLEALGLRQDILGCRCAGAVGCLFTDEWPRIRGRRP